MRCPVCTPTQPLWTETLEGALTARRCLGCSGYWIRAADYWRWRAQHAAAASPPAQHVLDSERTIIALHDTPRLRYCPEDRYILARYRVGHGVPFTLDRCRHCDGVWMDTEEWEILKGRGLHADLHEIFTEEWQQQVKEEEYQAREEAHWLRVLGEADYARVREVRAWLESHPQRVWLLEYLQLQAPPRGTSKAPRQ